MGGPGVPSQVTEDLNRGGTHAYKAVEDLGSAADVTADEYRHRAQDAVHRVCSFQDDSKQYIRENPTKAVLTALGVWFGPRFNFSSLDRE